MKINFSGLLGPRRACELLMWRLNGNVLAMKFDLYLWHFFPNENELTFK